MRPEALPAMLVEVRALLQITQREAARRAGVSLGAWGRYERGASWPSLRALLSIAALHPAPDAWVLRLGLAAAPRFPLDDLDPEWAEANPALAALHYRQRANALRAEALRLSQAARNAEAKAQHYHGLTTGQTSILAWVGPQNPAPALAEAAG